MPIPHPPIPPVPVPDSDFYHWYLNYIDYGQYQAKISQPTIVVLGAATAFVVLPLVIMLRLKAKITWLYYGLLLAGFVIGYVLQCFGERAFNRSYEWQQQVTYI